MTTEATIADLRAQLAEADRRAGAAERLAAQARAEVDAIDGDEVRAAVDRTCLDAYDVLRELVAAGYDANEGALCSSVEALIAERDDLRAKLAEAEHNRICHKCHPAPALGCAEITRARFDAEDLRAKLAEAEHLRHVADECCADARAERDETLARAEAAEAALPTVEERACIMLATDCTDLQGPQAGMLLVPECTRQLRAWLSRLPAPAAEAKAAQEAPSGGDIGGPSGECKACAGYGRGFGLMGYPCVCVWCGGTGRAPTPAAKPAPTQAERDRRLGVVVRAAAERLAHPAYGVVETIARIATILRKPSHGLNQTPDFLDAIADAIRAEREEAAK